MYPLKDTGQCQALSSPKLSQTLKNCARDQWKQMTTISKAGAKECPFRKVFTVDQKVSSQFSEKRSKEKGWLIGTSCCKKRAITVPDIDVTLLTWYCTIAVETQQRGTRVICRICLPCSPLLGFAVNWSCQCSFCAVQSNAKITSPFGPYSTKVQPSPTDALSN